MINYSRFHLSEVHNLSLEGRRQKAEGSLYEKFFTTMHESRGEWPFAPTAPYFLQSAVIALLTKY
ncbi:MAG: hypothetical protein F6K14_12080 [Symploca sp. SIO2C1]|nr:hypothetical protein [Symploca sp. SIO2C1]